MTTPWLPICLALSATSAVCYVMMGRVQARKTTSSARSRSSGGDSGSSGDGSWADVHTDFAGADFGSSCDAGDSGGGGDCGGD